MGVLVETTKHLLDSPLRVQFWYMCARFHAFHDDHAVRHRRRAHSTVEVSPRWNRLLTASLLGSSASYFLISKQKPSRFFTTIVEYFKIFHSINFQWSKSLAGKTFAVYQQSVKNVEVLTMKLLSFMVVLVD